MSETIQVVVCGIEFRLDAHEMRQLPRIVEAVERAIDEVHIEDTPQLEAAHAILKRLMETTGGRAK